MHAMHNYGTILSSHLVCALWCKLFVVLCNLLYFMLSFSVSTIGLFLFIYFRSLDRLPDDLMDELTTNYRETVEYNLII